MKKNNNSFYYNYALYEIDKFGEKKLLRKFFTLNELNFYMDFNKLSICELVDSCSYYPLYKYRIFSYRLDQFI